MTVRRHGFTATLLPDGSVLVAGGIGGCCGPNRAWSAELYDPATRGDPSSPEAGKHGPACPRSGPPTRLV